MRAVYYGRVSTDEQAKEGYSLASQEEKNTSFIKSQGWIHVDSYVDDGYSAKNLKRPDMKRLMEDTKKDKFDVVVFYKLDRLVRSVRDLEELLLLFDEHKVAIRSVTEPFDTTTAMGRFLITLVAAIAQWERETISERVIVTMSKKATLGERNGGRAPFGYDLVDGELVINEDEARVFKEAVRMYLSGKGLRQIAVFMKKNIRTISRMFENPVYAGKLRWGKNSKLEEIHSDIETHPAIIDEETFEQIQHLRKQRYIEGKKATSPFPFSGVLKCARCGSAMSGWNQKAKGTKHYICVTKKNIGTCDLPIINAEVLTKAFLGALSPDDPDKFLKIIHNINLKQTEQQDNEILIDSVLKELSAIKQRKRTWLLALGNNTISEDEYLEMTKEDTKKEKVLKEQLDDLDYTQETVQLDKESILKIAKDIPLLWEDATDYERKGFIRELFERIDVDVPRDYVRAPGNTPGVEIKGVSFK